LLLFPRLNLLFDKNYLGCTLLNTSTLRRKSGWMMKVERLEAAESTMRNEE